MTGVNFGGDATAAYAAMGYIAGLSTKVKTPAYVASVLRYTHSRLSYFFDIWMDELAKGAPGDYSHVYEWPTGWDDDKPDYQETVGHPRYRLWEHTMTGPAANATAGFIFTESHRATPVNPILADEGVKTGVHYFHFKAEVMEYAMPITVEPKLAKYLAYVVDGNKGGGGDQDGDRHTNRDGTVMFSKGPVNFTAGGGKFQFKFTSAFILFYQTLAQDHLKHDILPNFERDLADSQRFNTAIKNIGVRSQVKTMNITTAGERAYAEAEARAIADLTKDQEKYIRMSQGKAARLID